MIIKYSEAKIEKIYKNAEEAVENIENDDIVKNEHCEGEGERDNIKETGNE